MRQRQAQALALTDGVADDALVLSEHVAALIGKVARRIGLLCVGFDKPRVVAVRHKADVLAVVLVRVDKALFFGDGARLLLCHFAERKNGFGELRLRERIEHIALVLACIDGFFEQIPAACRVIGDGGVMPRHHTVKAQLLRVAQKLFEFDIAVAVDAGIGRAAVFVGADKALDDRVFKAFGKIVDKKRNAETAAHAARVLGAVERAAGLFVRCFLRTVKQTERHAGAVVAALQHQVCRHRAVHAAAHGDECFFCHLIHPDESSRQCSVRRRG